MSNWIIAGIIIVATIITIGRIMLRIKKGKEADLFKLEYVSLQEERRL